MSAEAQTTTKGGPSQPKGGGRKGLLALGALGVVFGDIGTSPLYAFQDIFIGDHPIPPEEHRVFGAASLVFWTLMLVVSVKYVMIVMRADNHGEGGIMALASLASSTTDKARKTRRWLIMSLGILGAALFYGDGMITPAMSVLSAVGGLEVAAPGLTDWVVPLSLIILIPLFFVQRHGTGKIGHAFGPVMLLWFFTIAVFGLMSLSQTPAVLAALNPEYALSFFVGEPKQAFLALGSVVLCVTGAEALYADMGQFGRGPIRLAWFGVTAIALVANYFGQAALLIRDPSADQNPFFIMTPDSLQLPMVILSTLATVIASQAVISGAFSMTKQAIALDYLPRLQVRHTSHTEQGQVYVPAVNWMLMVGVIVLVVVFQDSNNLGAAYGIAVTGTFVITTCLMTIVALTAWKVSPFIVWPVFAVFIVIDGSFFIANMTKFFHGGWFPLAVAAVIFFVLTTWRKGRKISLARLAKLGPPLGEFVAEIPTHGVTRVHGPKVYLTLDWNLTPFALVQHVRLLKAMSDQTVILQFESVDRPRVDDAERVIFKQDIPGITQIKAQYGFMERPDMRQVMLLCKQAGLRIDLSDAVFVVHQLSIEPSRDANMMLQRQYIYAVMQRLSINPSVYMHLPKDRILGVWTAIRLGGEETEEAPPKHLQI